VRLDFDESSLLQVHVPKQDLGTLLHQQVVHHPHGNVAHAFLGREFKYTTVCLCAHLRVTDHERHRVGDLQTCELVQRTCRQDNFVSSVNLGFSNEDGRVDSVLVQEYVSGMRVSNADV